jgi:hypothetical protein
MFTLTLFITAAILIGFFGGAFWLATAVTEIIFAKLFPMVTVFIVMAVIGLVSLRYYISK